MIADTVFLLDLARGDPGARALAEALDAGSEAVRVPAPAVAKLWEGVERSRRPPRERDALREHLLGLPGVAFEARHALAVARLLADAAEAGRALDPFDAMVAAVALVEDQALITRSRELEWVEGLRLRGY